MHWKDEAMFAGDTETTYSNKKRMLDTYSTEYLGQKFIKPFMS